MITCPSVSPENTYIMENGERGCVCAGATMDNEILHDLFTDYLKASEVLGIEGEIVDKSRDILSKIAMPQIGKHGQIMEWQEDYDEADAGHRHISHLYALYPSCQITPDKTPKLAEAARVTLKRRLDNGGGHTGWSCAWIVNFYARLWDGESAWENLQKLFEKSTFPNFMCNHPWRNGHVFQIDGNFGATAAIVEMLIQSDEDRTIFLPAIPKSWKTGHIRGIVIYSGATVDMRWDDNILTYCMVHVKNPLKTKLVYKNKIVQIIENEPVDYRFI
jgi:alpha-L-fucosidase 2